MIRRERTVSPCRRTYRGCRLVACLALAWLALAVPCAAAGPASPEAVLENVTAAISLDQAGQERGAQWESEQARLLDELRQARLEQAWYARQVEVFGGYVATARERVAQLQAMRREFQRMEAGLEGELVRTVDALKLLVDKDVPFLREERASRLAFLSRTVSDYELMSAEKLRRILEALQVELAYSGSVEVTQTFIEVDGAGQSVSLVRAGRIGLFALSPDEQRAWRWSRAGKFVPLDEAGVESVRNVVRMLAEKRVLSLPVLPFEEES